MNAKKAKAIRQSLRSQGRDPEEVVNADVRHLSRFFDGEPTYTRVLDRCGRKTYKRSKEMAQKIARGQAVHP